MPAINSETNSVEVVNISGSIVRFEIEGVRYKLAPKERVHLHKSYTVNKKMRPDADPVPSTIELLTNNMVVPVTDKRAIARLGNQAKAD